jgi:hypothetical protein
MNERLTIIAVKWRSSSNLVFDERTELSELGGLYKLKKSSGTFSENTCDSMAIDAGGQSWLMNLAYHSLTPKVEIQIP